MVVLLSTASLISGPVKSGPAIDPLTNNLLAMQNSVWRFIIQTYTDLFNGYYKMPNGSFVSKADVRKLELTGAEITNELVERIGPRAFQLIGESDGKKQPPNNSDK